MSDGVARRAAGGVGVFGGAFNPPHIGHLVLAQQAIHDLGLERLMVVPTGEAPHKEITPEPGSHTRLALARLAFEGVEWVEVSDLEVEREGPSYTFRTLELVADELHQSRPTFLVGADAAAGLDRWERPERVLELADIAVAARVGTDREAVEAVVSSIDAEATVTWIEMPEMGVSSTGVRRRVASGAPLRWLVPDPVIEQISGEGLYADGVSVESR